jgi:hypothetical protein
METNGIRMSIQLNDSFRTNPASHDVVLLFRLSNTTTNQVFEVYNSNEMGLCDGCSFECVLPAGKKVTTPTIMSIGSGGFAYIKPQQTREFTFNLNKKIQFDKSGTYLITAKKVMVSPETQSHSLWSQTRYNLTKKIINQHKEVASESKGVTDWGS